MAVHVPPLSLAAAVLGVPTFTAQRAPMCPNCGKSVASDMVSQEHHGSGACTQTQTQTAEEELARRRNERARSRADARAAQRVATFNQRTKNRRERLEARSSKTQLIERAEAKRKRRAERRVAEQRKRDESMHAAEPRNISGARPKKRAW